MQIKVVNNFVTVHVICTIYCHVMFDLFNLYEMTFVYTHVHPSYI